MISTCSVLYNYQVKLCFDQHATLSATWGFNT